MLDLSPEINFQTTRSGGKGGQNVNKVETAVIASLDIAGSAILSSQQKAVLLEKLSARISKEGFLQVKSQEYRTQLENKEDARRKITGLVIKALTRKKPRIATKPSRSSREKRLEWKKKQGEIKSGRRKFRPGES